jgi:F0F1-type ATP synthase assembly protein I
MKNKKTQKIKARINAEYRKFYNSPLDWQLIAARKINTQFCNDKGDFIAGLFVGFFIGFLILNFLT